MILFISSSERYTDWTGTAFALSILPNVGLGISLVASFSRITDLMVAHTVLGA